MDSFNLNKWITDNLISGVKIGKFSREWAAIQLADFFIRGSITQSDIKRFEEETLVSKSKHPDIFYSPEI
ncbi:MAG: hypothetical protein MSJ26_05720 [Oscillospiraceae bacterium]|nr:hypothetical protein [Oscillospiraceae bacterium]